ncbi:hypothetical protein CLV85_0450 [Salinibacterium amurskyense]|uniref:DinB family protein n=1 Tax=Salinibacterium amurskyense TaxID=205941 RepID=A0A2M9D6D7_9MICO|nr:ClbS/DfsB family four-helix bundle protein [Salinibacterium amurskyense]PJJ81279.1 hypothetical protein CLV85_0450 [Salinibacterium amurskyense]RLQ83290.1 DfsB family protein [Salinibacterium amurskyense]GHD81049.1 hypothetical protein GCM10007394_13590 [Salinibacterium amurskyense]
MAATSKDELLAVTHKEFEKLQQALEKVEADFAVAKDADDTSIKDIVGHRTNWIHLFLGWYEDGRAGKEVFFPAKGYKWNDLKQYNATIRAQQSDLGWSDARSALQTAHDDLVDFITGKSDADLYGGPMEGANNDWTPGRWAEAAGPSHFRSAAKYIRARLRAQTTPTADRNA